MNQLRRGFFRLFSSHLNGCQKYNVILNLIQDLCRCKCNCKKLIYLFTYPLINFKSAFTLAEVLITLGIIGVVAAMTIPNLMTKYHKHVVESRLKKFYSTMNQAVRLSINDHEDIILDVSALEIEEGGNHTVTDKNFEKEWFNEYILKYLSGVTLIDTQDTDGNQRGVKVSLNDGSGFTSFLYANGPGFIDLYVFYCINANDKSCTFNNYDGRNTFMFQYSDKHKSFLTSYATRRPTDFNILKNDTSYGCYKGGKQYCTRLIEMNGWKIPDDYPYIK